VKAEQWQIALRIYSTAQAIAVEERRAFIDSATADPEVVQQVLDLLEAGLEADSRPRSVPISVDRTGTRTGRYEIGKLLGRGGMGEVYAARDTELDRPAALKFLLPDADGEHLGTKRFVREAKAASALNHPNILTVYEVVHAESGLAIAMELVEGKAFRELCSKSLTSEQVVDLGRQVASALATAHEKGLVHRDIKPENLVLRQDGLAKVLDFGLARAFSARGTVNTQTAGLDTALGTPRYMSPEQLRGDALTGAADVFSLGIVLYELATGKHPFEADYAWETAYAIHSREPACPTSLNAAISRRLEALILAMLEKNPNARPSALQVMRFLQSLAGEGGSHTADHSQIQQHPVELIRDQRSHDTQAAHTARAVAPRAWRAALTIAVAGLAVYAWISRHEVRPEAPLKLVPLTTFAGAKDYAAFSPDGSRIAFSWNGGKEEIRERHIYVKPVGTGEPIQLTSAEQDDTWPAWSPDGRNIAFVRRLTGSERAIYVIPSSGGPEHKLAVGGEGVSWSQDGKWLALANLPAPKGSGGLFLISLGTGERRQLSFPENASDGFPVYSPDGLWIAFMRQRSDRDVFIMSARGGHIRQLTFDSKPKLGLTWTADSREIVYSMLREYGGAGLWRVSISGGEPRRLASTLDFAGNPNISRGGDRLAYTESWIDSNIYRCDGPGFLASGVPGTFGDPQKVIASSREDHSPSFSPDGERIAFVSNRTGHSEIWTARRDGSHEVQLTHFESFAGTPRWSPDGAWIAFDCIANGNKEIWTISAEGGTPRRLTNNSTADTKPSWSSDGSWIYFNSDRSGAPQVWKMKSDGSAATQLTLHGGREPLPSPDGRTVYYTKRVGPAPIWQVPAEGGPERPVAGMEEFNKVGRAWGVLKQGICFVSGEQGARDETIAFFSFATRHVTPLRTCKESATLSVPALALTSDGRHLLTVQTDQRVNDLMMVENLR
jgi:Tol biopolymer transport system component